MHTYLMEYYEFLIDKYIIRLNTYQSRLLDNKYIGCVNIYSTLHLWTSNIVLYYTANLRAMLPYTLVCSSIAALNRVGSVENRDSKEISCTIFGLQK